MSLPPSTSATPAAPPASTTTSTAPVVPAQAGEPAASVDDTDLPAAVGDMIVENDGDSVPVPFPDPDADGDDPDEVAPRDESASGPGDEG